MYKPNKNISINQSLMQCGRYLHFIQFIKNKRVRFGIKFYKLCDSQTRYIHNFKIYIEKNKTDSASRNSSSTLNRELYNMQTKKFLILKPTVIIDYNKNMGGIDIGLILNKFHKIYRCKKGYKKNIFLFCRYNAVKQLYPLQGT